jgi:hypothetical protein
VTPPPSAADRRPDDLAGDRDHVIGVRKSDLVEALIGNSRVSDPAQCDGFREICRRIAAIVHVENFAELERLRADYFYFNPEIEPHAGLDSAALERAYTDLIASLEAVAAEASFVEMTHKEVEAAHRARPVLKIDTRAPVEDFREVRFFRRGHHEETLETPGWLGAKRRSVPVLVYDDVVLLVAIKASDRISARERKRLARARVRPGAVLIKHFRNVASFDLNALFPDVSVVLSLRDKVLLSGPAVAGGIPILLKLASTITVLFLVLGFYFGLSASVAEEESAGALAAMSGLVALGSFMARQWLRYQKQSLKYQKELTENIYFRNTNNNAGVFDAMVAAAEDQECKEAFLVFYFLQDASLSDRCALKNAIETWLEKAFGIEVEFKVDDALARLERLGLIRQEGGRSSALPMEQALSALERVWSAFLKTQQNPT